MQHQRLPMPSQSLEDTVARCNSFVETGKDDDFGKPTPLYKIAKPPFYAAWATPIVHDTRAGLRINASCEVIDMNAKVIPGLYCGGESAGGFSRLCQLSRLLIDYVSAILPRAQAVSRMPSAIAALRMCCQRRVAAGTRWRMRDRQRRKFRSSSWPRQYRLADPVLFNPSIGRHRPLMPR